MQTVLLIVYLALVLTTLYCTIFKPNYFLFCFLCLMAVSPNVQYIIYNTIGENSFTTTYRRLSLEFINIILMIVFILYNKVLPHKSGFYVKLFFAILVLWNILHSLNILVAIDLNRSLIFYLISVLGPSIFFYLILYSKDISLKEYSLTNTIFLFSLFFYSIGLVFIGYRILKFGSFLDIGFRTAGGLYLSNYAINIMALLAPLAFLTHPNGPLKFKIGKLLFSVYLIINQVFAVSRLGMVIYLIFFLKLRVTSINSLVKTTIGLLLILFGVYYYFLNYIGLDMLVFIQDRFMGDSGSIAERSGNDERFRIWKETINHLLIDPKLILSGIGISNYRLADPEVLLYSNSHNLFLNVLFERGITIFFILLSQIIFLVFFCKKLLKMSVEFSEYHKYFIRALVYGLLLFLIIEFFYNDLFSASGQQTGLLGYMFYFSIAILLKYYNYFMSGVSFNEK